MTFQIGKYYKHTSGEMMHIISGAKSTMYDWCLIAEHTGEPETFRPVGQDKANAQNWTESTEDEWMKKFS